MDEVLQAPQGQDKDIGAVQKEALTSRNVAIEAAARARVNLKAMETGATLTSDEHGNLLSPKDMAEMRDLGRNAIK